MLTALSSQTRTRASAIKLDLTDIGPGTISDDANNDTAVIGSDGQDYTAAFDSISGCTNFNHGEYTLSNGASQVGCVTFQLPNDVHVKAVQFSIGGHTIQFNDLRPATSRSSTAGRAGRRLPISEHLHQQLLAGGRQTVILCELEARSLVKSTPALVDTGTLRRIVAGTL